MKRNPENPLFFSSKRPRIAAPIPLAASPTTTHHQKVKAGLIDRSAPTQAQVSIKQTVEKLLLNLPSGLKDLLTLLEPSDFNLPSGTQQKKLNLSFQESVIDYVMGANIPAKDINLVLVSDRLLDIFADRLLAAQT